MAGTQTYELRGSEFPFNDDNLFFLPFRHVAHQRLAAPLPVPTSRGLPPPGRKDQAMEDASLRPATRPNLYVPRRSSRIALHAPAAILNMPRRHHQATLGNAAHHGSVLRVSAR